MLVLGASCCYHYGCQVRARGRRQAAGATGQGQGLLFFFWLAQEGLQDGSPRIRTHRHRHRQAHAGCSHDGQTSGLRVVWVSRVEHERRALEGLGTPTVAETPGRDSEARAPSPGPLDGLGKAGRQRRRLDWTRVHTVKADARRARRERGARERVEEQQESERERRRDGWQLRRVHVFPQALRVQAARLYHPRPTWFHLGRALATALIRACYMVLVEARFGLRVYESPLAPTCPWPPKELVSPAASGRRPPTSKYTYTRTPSPKTHDFGLPPSTSLLPPAPWLTLDRSVGSTIGPPPPPRPPTCPWPFFHAASCTPTSPQRQPAPPAPDPRPRRAVPQLPARLGFPMAMPMLHHHHHSAIAGPKIPQSQNTTPIAHTVSSQRLPPAPAALAIAATGNGEARSCAHVQAQVHTPGSGRAPLHEELTIATRPTVPSKCSHSRSRLVHRRRHDAPSSLSLVQPGCAPVQE